MKFFGKLNLEDFLLCTPYEERYGRDLSKIYPGFLTEELFVNELYSPPKEKNNESQDESQQDDIFLTPISIMSNKITISEFEASLKADSSEPLFVRGYSGTGKTTFIRTLLYKIRNENENYRSICFDLQDSSDTVSLFKKYWYNENFNINICKLYSLFIHHINLLMNKDENENSECYRNRLTNVYRKYFDCFQRQLLDERIDKIFTVINLFIKGEIPYENRYDDSFCNRMHSNISKLVDYNDERRTFNMLITLADVFLYCSSTEKTKYFIFYDNIEHYLKADVLYDDEISNIVNIIRDSHKNMETYFSDNNINYTRYFRLILVVRDTTHNLIRYPYEQYSDFPGRFINVSSFYNMSEIINNKKKYFSQNNKNTIINEIYEGIIKPRIDLIDIVAKISSDRFILDLYNHNKRRIVIYLVNVVAMEKNSDKVERYKYMMDKVDKLEKKDKNIIDAYKNGARSIIRRMLLDLIQGKEYFSRMKAVTNNSGENDVTLGFGYARRILTYLHNRTAAKNADEVYIGLYTLIKDVFEFPFESGKIPYNLIANVAEIINTLADRRLEETNWSQLVVLKFNKKYDSVDLKEIIEEEIKKQYCNDKADNKDFGVKITFAGQTFVKLSSNFEYYACRYCPEMYPLFAITDKNQVISLLETVKNKAMQCIEKSIEDMKKFLECDGKIYFEELFSKDDKPKYILLHANDYPQKMKQMTELIHTVQIINSHIGYLSNYRLFLINENLFDKKLMLFVLNIINAYIDKFEKIREIKSEIDGEIQYYLGKLYYKKYCDVIEKYKKQIFRAINDSFNKNILINGREN